MKRFFTVVLVRWLSKTPIGLALLALGWVFGRRNRRRARHEAERAHGRTGRRTRSTRR